MIVGHSKEYRKKFRSKPEQKARQQAYNKAYRLKNKEKIKEIKLRFKESPNFKNKSKNSRLKNRFNITFDQFNSMLIEQNYVCKICKKSETAVYKYKGQIKTKDLAVDHCHVTNKVRGLLCSNCNRALGHFKDSEENLFAAIEYLRKTK